MADESENPCIYFEGICEDIGIGPLQVLRTLEIFRLENIAILSCTHVDKGPDKGC